jgi:hypothetical protein
VRRQRDRGDVGLDDSALAVAKALKLGRREVRDRVAVAAIFAGLLQNSGDTKTLPWRL